MEVRLDKMTVKTLNQLKNLIDIELKSRQTIEKFLISENELCTLLSSDRYNGGWMKTVTSLDKSKTNGYSIVGEFLPKDSHMFYVCPNDLIIDCDIRGSRKNQKKYYTLFKIVSKEKIEVLFQSEPNDFGWAPKMWEKIEKNLK